ncbi:MAG: hybrid sensor histidine kinase/response regulator [Firmicutes bacterium]|nr:hybrid sensor histidine kinase/response regulator [Bacillota bacterium]
MKSNTILIVDDDPISVRELARILGEQYTVFAATSGKRALELAGKHVPDLILLDIVMPEMDGYQLLTILRTIDELKEIPVIFITGLDGEEDEMFGLSLNAADYISKPFNKTIVSLRVRNQIQIVNAMRTIEESYIAEINMLDRITRMRTEFFQNMSHDFKTPLTVISTSIFNVTDMLNFGDLNKEEMQESLENAQREIMRMARMVDSALKLSTIYDGHQKMESIDMVEFLNRAASVYRNMLVQRKNKLLASIPKSLPQVSGNSDMLMHVLANLLSNANRYTYDGQISINAMEGDGMVIVTVRDNGTGVKPELLPHVFERGVSDSSTGFGLSICKVAIEEVHKGTISLTSEYGQGTAVMFTLPAHSR